MNSIPVDGSIEIIRAELLLLLRFLVIDGF